jgi:hypothetical protein
MHSKIRNTIKFVGMTTFGIYVIYRLKEIVVNGGKLLSENDVPKESGEIEEVVEYSEPTGTVDSTVRSNAR